jgi:hypothetical protein
MEAADWHDKLRAVAVHHGPIKPGAERGSILRLVLNHHLPAGALLVPLVLDVVWTLFESIFRSNSPQMDSFDFKIFAPESQVCGTPS